MAQTCRRIAHLVVQIQSAFLDDARLSLTLPAAKRRFGIDEATCAGVIGALVDAHVLTEHDGIYRRYVPRPAIRTAA